MSGSREIWNGTMLQSCSPRNQLVSVQSSLWLINLVELGFIWPEPVSGSDDINTTSCHTTSRSIRHTTLRTSSNHLSQLQCLILAIPCGSDSCRISQIENIPVYRHQHCLSSYHGATVRLPSLPVNWRCIQPSQYQCSKSATHFQPRLTQPWVLLAELQ